jgi:hypothetical protein
MCLMKCGFLLILLPLYIFFKNISSFPISPSLHTVHSYMCVCAGEIKVLLLRSVMSAVPVPSKNSLKKVEDFSYSGLL